jgi:hypothetical protein
MRYDASAGSVEYYVNGSIQGTTQTGHVTNLKNSTGVFMLGRPDFNFAGQYFDGMMDEVGLWNKYISTTEITDLYNSGTGIPYDAGGPPPSTNLGTTVFFQ